MLEVCRMDHNMSLLGCIRRPLALWLSSTKTLAKSSRFSLKLYLSANCCWCYCCSPKPLWLLHDSWCSIFTLAMTLTASASPEISWRIIMLCELELIHLCTSDRRYTTATVLSPQTWDFFQHQRPCRLVAMLLLEEVRPSWVVGACRSTGGNSLVVRDGGWRWMASCLLLLRRICAPMTKQMRCQESGVDFCLTSCSLAVVEGSSRADGPHCAWKDPLVKGQGPVYK
jgi:hypothetical protein